MSHFLKNEAKLKTACWAAGTRRRSASPISMMRPGADTAAIYQTFRSGSATRVPNGVEKAQHASVRTVGGLTLSGGSSLGLQSGLEGRPGKAEYYASSEFIQRIWASVAADVPLQIVLGPGNIEQ